MDSGLKVSDGKLRDILCELNHEGLVEIGKGRYGTKITPKGLYEVKETSRSGL